MVAGFLDVFRGGTDLVVMFLLDVVNLLTSVECLTSLGKVVLHQVNVFIIVFHVHAWVLDQDDAELVEALCNLLALFKGLLINLLA
jgi:hypothetical protein